MFRSTVHRGKVSVGLGLSVACLAVHAVPAQAASFRYQDWASGSQGTNTERVRIIWDANIVDADTIYYFGTYTGSQSLFGAIELERNGVRFDADVCRISEQVPVCDYSYPLGNIAGLQSYVTRFDAQFGLHSSPVISV